MNDPKAKTILSSAREKRTFAKRDGGVMVEFAIVTPILFMFFFGAFEFCRAAMIRHTADNAVYEAARCAVVPGATAVDAKKKAVSIMNSLGVSNVNVDILPKTIDRETSDVTVRIKVPIAGNSFVPVKFIKGDIVRELTLHREGSK